MRIAIEATASCRTPRTGIALYTIHLVNALADLARETGDALAVGYRFSRWPNRRICHAPPGAGTFWIQEPLWPLRPRADVIHGTDARVPHWRGAARVATVHDLAVHLFPEYSTPEFRDVQMAKYRRLTETCHKIIVHSEATRRDLLGLLDYPDAHVVTVPIGIEPVFRPHDPQEVAAVRVALGLERPYLLFVGEITSRKNTENLVRAYGAAGLRKDYDLVLAGTQAYGGEATLAAIRELGLERDVRLLGFVPFEDLPPLYAGAEAYLFATGYEGFGLPLLEAMASGVPAVGSNRGATPEVAGGHAVLVDPEDPAAIAAGITKALDLSPAAREAARIHATSYSWEACARATREAYAQALARKAAA